MAPKTTMVSILAVVVWMLFDACCVKQEELVFDVGVGEEVGFVIVIVVVEELMDDDLKSEVIVALYRLHTPRLL